jgi:hypothetical protein
VGGAASHRGQVSPTVRGTLTRKMQRAPSTPWLAFGLLAALGCGPAPGWEEIAAPAHDAPGRSTHYAHDRDAEELAEPVRQQAVARGLTGRWVGVGHQSDGPSWRMELDVARTDDGPCAVVRYPDDDCAGYWTCTEVSGRRLLAVEHITVGAERCAARVDVGVELQQSGQLVFRAVAGDVTAGARLERAR